MMQTMKLIEYRRLLVIFNKNKIKELEDETKKLRLQLANQIVENNNNHKR